MTLPVRDRFVRALFWPFVFLGIWLDEGLPWRSAFRATHRWVWGLDE